MRWGAKLGVMTIAVIFLMPLLMPSNAEYEGKKLQVKAEWITPFGKETKIVEMTEKDIRLLQKQMEESQDVLKILTDPSSNDDDKNKAIEILEALIEKLKEFGLVPPTFTVEAFLMNLFSPKIDIILPIISFGSGFSWIPLYPGEAFIGFMFRPIFMQYFLVGYTASVNLNLLPPRLEYWDMVGTHTLIVWGFVGIYIDFGKIGYGIPNLQFLMGEALFAGGFDWL
ncbi:MAG: hypothetical protein DRN11_02930 [Thermoplasmata archaeon]|nr:MAG: hypothetical protein DRN11_02930 [Thermoplasmata archaeon]